MIGNARVQLDPDVWEMPGMMPEISPSPDFGANIDRLFTERSMVMQAWGAYGVLWPVVHHWLGVSPDLGRGRVSVVPQLPPSEDVIIRRAHPARRHAASMCEAQRTAPGYITRLNATAGCADHRSRGAGGSTQSSRSRLDGDRVRARLVETARGLEVRVDAGLGAAPGWWCGWP